MSKQNNWTFSDLNFFTFVTGVNNSAPWAENISAKCWKKLKGHLLYTQGLGGNWSMKKSKTWSRKSRGTVSLNCFLMQKTRGQRDRGFVPELFSRSGKSWKETVQGEDLYCSKCPVSLPNNVVRQLAEGRSEFDSRLGTSRRLLLLSGEAMKIKGRLTSANDEGRKNVWLCCINEC